MAYEKINQPIVDAVDILIDKKLQEAGYDKTVSATIVQCISPLTGKHLIQRTEGQKEIAYSQNGITYNAGDQVYITIPSNDSTMDKQILGMQRHEATFAAKSQLSLDKRFNKINTYTFENNGNNEWILNEDIEIPDDRTILQNASFILRFNLGIKPVGKYDPDVLKDISYSFALKDEDEDENNPPLDTLSIDEIKGNPYYTDKPVEQIKIFNNPKLAKCKKIIIPEDEIKDYLTFTIDSMEFIVAQDLLDPEIEDYWIAYSENCGIEEKTYTIEEYKNLTDAVKKEYYEIKAIYENDIITAYKGIRIIEGNTHEKHWIQYYDKGKQITDTVFCYWAMKNSNVTVEDKLRYSSYTEEGWELKQRTTASIDGSEDYFLVEKGQLPYYSNEFKCVIVEIANQIGKYPFIVNNPNRSSEDYKIILSGFLKGTTIIDKESGYLITATLNPSLGMLPQDATINFNWKLYDSFGAELKIALDDTETDEDASNWDFKEVENGITDEYLCYSTIFIKAISLENIINLLIDCEAFLNIKADKFSIAILTKDMINEDKIAGFQLMVKNASQSFYYNGIYEGGNPIPLEVQLWENGKQIKKGWSLKAETSTNSLIILKDIYSSSITVDAYNKLTEAEKEEYEAVKNTNGNITSYKNTATFKVPFEVAQVYNYNNSAEQIILKASISGKNEDNIIFSTSFTFMSLGDPGTNGTEYVAQIINASNNVCNFIRKAESYNGYKMRLTNIRTGKTLELSNIEQSILMDKAEDGTEIHRFLQLKGKPKIDEENNNIYDYYAYASIIDGMSGNFIEQNSGFNFVLYGSNGRNPRCPLKDFKRTGNDTINPYYDSNYNQEYIRITDTRPGKIELTNKPLTSESPPWILLHFYLGGIEDNAKYADIPILLLKNRYEYAAINDWDGQGVKIGKEYVLSPMAGFGKKNEDNSFTGVVLGETSENKQGLMAYNNGARTVFIDAETGSAYFGVSGNGQIVIDGQSGTVSGGNGKLASNDFTESGMIIDFSNGSIHATNFKIVNGNAVFQGEISATTGDIAGFLIRDNRIFKQNENNIVGLSSGNTYAFWAGNGNEYGENASFRVTHDGQLYATKAAIEGSLRAGDDFSVDDQGNLNCQNGQIGPFSLRDSGLSYAGLNITTQGISLTGDQKLQIANMTIYQENNQAYFYSPSLFKLQGGNAYFALESLGTDEQSNLFVQIDTSQKQEIDGFLYGLTLSKYNFGNTMKITVAGFCQLKWDGVAEDKIFPSNGLQVNINISITFKPNVYTASPSVQTKTITLTKTLYKQSSTMLDPFLITFDFNHRTNTSEPPNISLDFDQITNVTFSVTGGVNGLSSSYTTGIPGSSGLIVSQVATCPFIFSTSNRFTIKGSFVPSDTDSYNLGQSGKTWQNLFYSGELIKDSDFQLKQNIKNLNELQIYNNFYDSLKPLEYVYKQDSNKKIHFGCIAQDIKQSIDLYLQKEKYAIVYSPKNDEEYYGLDYTEFIALNIDQIQKLKKRVALLEAQLKEIKGEQTNENNDISGGA